ncbi:MAG: biotin--[Lachnospiraceae bacterium]|nr:biotin--[acetyl-CoA-carboxylase] ligase [Lachnospiraceae bacterium]
MKNNNLSANQLKTQELKEILCTKWLGKPTFFFNICDSTNIRLQELANAGAREGYVVVSEEQTAGQGRNGRNWNSPKGEGIFLSMLLRPEFQPKYASMITLVTALAVCYALEKNGMENLFIKWPNDIVAGGKKLCGILTKMCTDADTIKYVIVGLGINVSQKNFPPKIAEIATSIYLETKEEKSRMKIIADVLAAYETYYEQFQETKDLSLLKEEYNQKLVHRNSMVRIIEEGQEKTVKALGINEKGELLVEEQGQIRTILAGEISVRGIYGYT